ncbi:substrate-binding domain-containing protein [Krasilnikoviella flava]|uniref:DNA-binding transcriptional regulator, LacI/PurR family n=1 Tax=Krasilnikoviella flava TaxID=526729 RepID=A0A1T5LXR1_9MICO|nr:substrate-binding domain-containing protein [Krasilnikoviella flava]SKC80722.1 DNA-binding transcriptional regulator, LacI/PurR family [Krasilnikoviella flava]
MIAAERKDAVLRELRLRGTLSVAEFSGRIGAAPVTLRRDLRELEREGRLARVHGGARALHGAPLPDGDARAVTRLAATFGIGPRAAADAAPVATIGMIAPTASYYYRGVIEGAKDAARLAGVRLVLAVSEYDEDEELRLFRRMVGLGLDGILITPATQGVGERALRQALDESPVPVTVVERGWDLRTRGQVIDSVRSDHLHGAGLAADHLLDLGHERLAVWTSENPHAVEVRDGFTEAVGRRGAGVVTPRFTAGRPDRSPADPAAAVRRYLDEVLDAGVTAVLVHPDQLALQLAQAALARGLDIPGDLSIVAYDDEVASLGELPLTAVAPPKHALGFAAIDACLRAVAHRSPVASSIPARFPAQRVRLLPELVARASTAPPPAIARPTSEPVREVPA